VKKLPVVVDGVRVDDCSRTHKLSKASKALNHVVPYGEDGKAKQGKEARVYAFLIGNGTPNPKP
jgi:hypothetical protein